MKEVMDFLRSAFPWVAMGLAVAIGLTCANSKNKKQDDKEYKVFYLPIGMVLGVPLGAVFNSLAIGISTGILIGTIADAIVYKKKQKK